MAVTILEALENAEINLVINPPNVLGQMIGKEQLHNAIVLLEKGYSADTLVDPLLEEFGDVEKVPEHKEESDGSQP
jgi:hypothetical protein